MVSFNLYVVSFNSKDKTVVFCIFHKPQHNEVVDPHSFERGPWPTNIGITWSLELRNLWPCT